MHTRSTTGFWIVQFTVILAFGLSIARGSLSQGPAGSVPGTVSTGVRVEREYPLRIAPLYDDASVVSDEELAAVLKQVRPKFPEKNLKPNFIEHALRIWGVDAVFQEKGVLSGLQMKEFLTNHGKYLASWGTSAQPLLIDTQVGVSIRWGGHEEGGSVHHDHWLACLTEAGVAREEKIFTPAHRIRTIDDALQQGLLDFHVDERETEWSALGFGLWLPPAKSWRTADGRTVTFDTLAQRLLRGALRFGVCNGTHRLYSLTALVRLDDEYHILSPEVRAEIMAHLHYVRELIVASQYEDGHWGSNWQDGADALKNPAADPMYKKVINTGHHLEWLAIAPEELHPPREQIRKAARWIIDTTVAQKPEDMQQFYTFFSHVGGALSLWRNTHPAAFYREWERTHPVVAEEQAAVDRETTETD